MKTVKIESEALLKTLKENRLKHVENYKKALEQYRLDLIELVKAQILSRDTDLEALQAGALERTYSNGNVGEIEFNPNGMAFFRGNKVPFPVNYEKDYTKAITMIEMGIDTVIEVDPDEFSKYVLDDWSWSKHFYDNTMSYALKAGV